MSIKPILVLWLLACLPLVGCAAGGGDLPGGSRLVAESPAVLVFVATEPGTAFLRQRGAEHSLYSVQLDLGQSIRVEPVTGNITVSGHAPVTFPLSDKEPYELFFKPAGKREYHPMLNP